MQRRRLKSTVKTELIREGNYYEAGSRSASLLGSASPISVDLKVTGHSKTNKR
jgi:hypothetical protein